MNFNVYNLKNQKLSAEELISILQYSTKHFAGSIGDTNPLVITNNEITFNANKLTMLVDGMRFELTDGGEQSITDGTTLVNRFFAIVIDINAIKQAANISSNTFVESNAITFQTITGFTSNSLTVGYVADTNKQQIQIIDNNDTTVGWKDFRYNAKIFTSYYSASNVNQIAGSKYYIIPIAAYFDDVVQPLFKNFTLDSYEQFLTDLAVSRLNDRFVWRSGGKDKGNIGSLNVTDSTIKKHTDTTNPIIFDHNVKFVENAEFSTSVSGNGLDSYIKTKLDKFKKDKLDPEYVTHKKGGRIADIVIENEVISSRPGSGSDRINIDAKYVRFPSIAKRLNIEQGQAYPVWMEANGNISAKYRNLPISMGGTGAATWMDARSNLHIHVLRVENRSSMAAAINYMKEKYYAEPAGTICFLVAHYNNKHDLAICLKRSAASSGDAWDIIEQ